MVKVYKESMSLSYEVAEFDTEKEAVEFCEYYGWELIDENGFGWRLVIDN